MLQRREDFRLGILVFIIINYYFFNIYLQQPKYVYTSRRLNCLPCPSLERSYKASCFQMFRMIMNTMTEMTESKTKYVFNFLSLIKTVLQTNMIQSFLHFFQVVFE
jgi:hypothetical protein